MLVSSLKSVLENVVYHLMLNNYCYVVMYMVVQDIESGWENGVKSCNVDGGRFISDHNLLMHLLALKTLTDHYYP